VVVAVVVTLHLCQVKASKLEQVVVALETLEMSLEEAEAVVEAVEQ
jgi:hypothetical protein